LRHPSAQREWGDSAEDPGVGDQGDGRLMRAARRPSTSKIARQ
jgi:hypothetical protein